MTLRSLRIYKYKNQMRENADKSITRVYDKEKKTIFLVNSGEKIAA